MVTTKPFTDATPAVFGTQDDFRDDEAAISDSMIRNGLLLGPDSDTVFFQDPQVTSQGNLPSAIWWTTNHTNELVPLWSRGPGSERFAVLIDGIDPRRGNFIDNTDVYTGMSSVIPEPATFSVLVAMSLLVLRRRGLRTSIAIGAPETPHGSHHR